MIKDDLIQQMRYSARALRSAAQLLWNSSIRGNAGTKTDRALFERMQDLRRGDLVCELSAAYQSDDLDSVGTLIKAYWERIKTDGWNPLVDGPYPTERVYHIRTLDGRNFRWRNARMVAIPEAFPDGANFGEYRFNILGDTTGHRLVNYPVAADPQPARETSNVHD